MILVVNIPCLNEEATLPVVLEAIPKEIPGVSRIEIQVIDDGSTDRTAQIARDFGCKVISHRRNRGLGLAFKTGMYAALASQADILVNIDADNQYPPRYIPELIRPILEEKADMVVGDRCPWKVPHFSPIKRSLQYLGNHLTRRLADSSVKDMVSGFRAYSKEALLQLNVTTKFSYVLDTIVQASKKGLRVDSIPVETNPPTRPSRLFHNIFEHIRKSTLNILRLYLIYEPFRTFSWLALIISAPGVALVLRFLILYFTVGGAGHIQSLVISVIFMLLAAMSFVIGAVAGLIGVNRSLTEDQLYWEKQRLYSQAGSNTIPEHSRKP